MSLNIWAQLFRAGVSVIKWWRNECRQGGEVSAVICDKSVAAKAKQKVYQQCYMVWRRWHWPKINQTNLEVAELKTLRFFFGVTRMDRIRDKHIRVTEHVGHLENKVRDAWLGRFGHLHGATLIGRRMLNIELPGRRQRKKPKRGLMNLVSKQMLRTGREGGE